MTFPLYHHNANYYIIIDRGNSFNYALDFNNYSTKMISNEELQSYDEIELTRENLIETLTQLNKISGLNFDDYDKFKYNHMILCDDTPYYINSWKDVMNIVRYR